MDSTVLQADAKPTGPLHRAAEAVNNYVLAMFALLASHGRLPARMEKLWADTRADSNPIKDIAVGFILIGVSLVIALTILPVITSAVETAAADPNVSATDATLLRLLPTLLIVGLLAGGVAFLFRGFRAVRA